MEIISGKRTVPAGALSRNADVYSDQSAASSNQRYPDGSSLSNFHDGDDDSETGHANVRPQSSTAMAYARAAGSVAQGPARSVAGSAVSSTSQGSTARVLGEVLEGSVSIDESEIRIVRRATFVLVLAIAAMAIAVTVIVQ